MIAKHKFTTCLNQSQFFFESTIIPIVNDVIGYNTAGRTFSG